MELVYDRGTLILRHPSADIDAGALPDVMWDPRTRQWRAPAWCYPRLRAALPPEVDRVRPDLPVPPPFPPPALRPYQAAAVAAWRRGRQRGLIALPTGTGKTRTAIAAIAETGQRALVLAPTRVLQAQWARALDDAGALGVGQYGDGRRQWGPITVATFASARAHADHLGPRFDLLVVDEAHHFGHGGFDEVLELYIAPSRLGLTATPPLEPDRRARLERLIGPTVFESSVEQMAGQWLSAFRVVRLAVPLTSDERRRYDASREAFSTYHRAFRRLAPDAPWSEFAAAARRTDAGREALIGWRRSRAIVAWPQAKRAAVGELLARHADARIILFAPDNATAYAIARTHLVMPITCEIGPAERASALDAFAHGRIGALVSARVLNEGVDVPDADVAILVGGQHGSREYVQRVGRVLRPAPGKRALVYELVAQYTHEVDHAMRGRARLAAA